MDIERFAPDVGVSPGIVVGPLHNDGPWDWGRDNRLRRRIQITEE